MIEYSRKRTVAAALPLLIICVALLATMSGSDASSFGRLPLKPMETRRPPFMAADALGKRGLARTTIDPHEQGIVPAATDFNRAAAITLTANENDAFTGLIDEVNGYAYYATFNSTSAIVKVRLSDFTRVGQIMLNPEEIDMRSGVLDTAGGYAYFGGLSGYIVKIRLSDFTRVGSINTNVPMAAATIDPANGFAYFGAYTSPAAVVKVRLLDFRAVDELVFNSDETGILSAVIDTANGFAYFGTDDTPGVVVKVRLSDFTRVGGVHLNSGEDELTCAVIDPQNGFAYFGSFSLFFRVIKIRLSDLSRVDGIYENTGQSQLLRSAVIDTVSGDAYFAGDSSYVIKIRLSDFSHTQTLKMNQPEAGGNSGVIDVANGYAYFMGRVQSKYPGVIRVRLADFTESATVAFSYGENNIGASVIDNVNGFAYFGTGSPGVIIKIRLSDFSYVASLPLNDDEFDVRSAVIDQSNGFAYFGTDTSPGKIIKIRLSDFTRVGALTLNSGENELFSAVIDDKNGFAYFGAVPYPLGIIVKIRLSDFTRVGAVILNDTERPFCGVIDTTNGFAYFGAPTLPGMIIKIRLSDFSRVGALTLNEPGLVSAIIDSSNTFAYFGTNGGSIVKIRLSDFTRVGALNGNGGEMNFGSAVTDGSTFAYFGTLGGPGQVMKVRLSDFTRVDGLTLLTGEGGLATAVIDNRSSAAYFGTGTFPGRIVKINLSAAATPTPTPTATPNPIDQPSFFVHQNYTDFLNREPDQSGMAFWTGQMTNCGASDLTVCRVNVSGAFFLSIEFQQTGYLVERMYKVAYGDATATSTVGGSHQILVPLVRFSEFLNDTQRIGQGVVVLQPGWEQTLENNKQAYGGEFVASSRFIAAFPTTMTPAQFVDQLNQNAGNVLSQSERQTAINLFGNAADTTNVSARTQALRQVSEDKDLNNAEYNRAFVLAEYFGYLRRNPNDPPESTLDYTGYEFWLNKLNQFNGDYVAAEMVKAFISSGEYRRRFGP